MNEDFLTNAMKRSHKQTDQKVFLENRIAHRCCTRVHLRQEITIFGYFLFLLHLNNKNI